MIARLRRANREQRKLLFSVGINFLTRVPGAIGLLWFLPLLRFGLGTDDYAALLSSIALGTAAAFLFVGFNLIGRRLIGEAYADGNKAGEADGFISVIVANLAASGVAFTLIAALCVARGDSFTILAISMIPALGAFLMIFDDVRAAYNEHYITATLFVIIQSTAYATGFLVPATRHSLMLGTLVIAIPYLLSSLITGVLLLYRRPYLMRGRLACVRGIMSQGVLLALADGFLMASLSFSVVWLQSSADSTTSAWFATIVRLFQTLLMPVLLLLHPMSSYVRIRWNSKSVTQRQTFTKVTLVLGFGYGTIVAVALFVASQFYVNHLLRLPIAEVSRVWPIFLLFGAIIAYKSYSSVAYLVLDKPAHLSSWTTVAISSAVAVGVASSFAVDPLAAVDVYALVAGLSMTAVLSWSAGRFIWPSVGKAGLAGVPARPQ